MAIGEVAGSTVSTAFASTQLNSTQRSAQQELQASAQTTDDTGGTDAAQSVTAVASSGDSNTSSTGDPSRGTRLDITI